RLGDMRIMTRGAGHLAGASQEALRFAQPVSRVGDLETLTLSAFAIEGEPETSHWLPRDVGERSDSGTQQRMRQRKRRCLQVALHADFELAIRAQALRIHNAGADLRGCCAGASHGFDVLPPRPVASLAIDPFRQGLEELRYR